ncbi:hypothetical protein FHG64_03685 [Antarcticibacterium flavum]|uniref:Uncharacterized protein n=1 Tax=Antarcticibacterium flavum TaxID=2058175 RepID=A0A5B7WZF3_9FLAO|nr:MULTISPECIES: hypothetical protein [Antarcticibacterium]MCM4158713.1 hypothetical protein [Antarcticibacterium sp. W02-3]QCY68566.1 hypothetical protein FHG64_03685 [Antarcticibacterium flavum]
MRAKVILQEFNLEDGLRCIVQKLSEISGLRNIRINQNEGSISFEYLTDDAALKVMESVQQKC